MPEIQWLPAVVAGLAGFILGGLWYSPVLFARPWLRETGLDPKGPLRYPALVPMAVAVLQGLGGAFVLSALLGPGAGAVAGLLCGAAIGFLAVAPAIKMNGLFGQNSPMLITIQALYPALEFTLMGLILGLWPS